jgi:hypothetical protein
LDFFTVSAAGPGVGGHEISGVPANANDEESTFVTPQLDGSIGIGDIYGETVAEDIINYEGSALVGGGSYGTGTAEAFSSVNPESGMPDLEVTGYTIGASGGIDPGAEIHVFYTNAIYQREISSFLTKIAELLGIVN